MKNFIVLTAATLSAPVLAGPYVNVETNASYTGSDYTSRATDLHVGYETKLGSLDWYVQGGQTVNLKMDLKNLIQVSLVNLVAL